MDPESPLYRATTVTWDLSMRTKYEHAPRWVKMELSAPWMLFSL
jgi:hypothetical protein